MSAKKEEVLLYLMEEYKKVLKDRFAYEKYLNDVNEFYDERRIKGEAGHHSYTGKEAKFVGKAKLKRYRQMINELMMEVDGTIYKDEVAE